MKACILLTACLAGFALGGTQSLARWDLLKAIPLRETGWSYSDELRLANILLLYGETIN